MTTEFLFNVFCVLGIFASAMFGFVWMCVAMRTLCLYFEWQLARSLRLLRITRRINWWRKYRDSKA